MSNTALNRTTVAILTNKSGGSLAFGAVVILDNTNANGFTTTTTSALATRCLGVIMEPNGIANNASGMVGITGWVPQINLDGAATIGQFFYTSTVAGQATPHSSPQLPGDFGVALSASATPPAILFGSANGPASGLAIAGSANDIQLNNGAGNLSALTPASGVATFIATPSGANLASALTTALPDTKGGTGLTSLGTGVATFLGTPSGANLASALTTALPATKGGTGLTALGTGVATALGVNVGSAGAFVTFNGALGTPSGGTLTNATGLPISSGVSGLGTGVATALAVNTGSAGAFVVFNGALGTPASGVGTNLTGIPTTALLTGAVVQVVNTETGAVATGTTVIPADDTIPQITEGTEFMTLAITPKSASNKLKIEIVAQLACATSGRAIAMALFQDSTANALACIAKDINIASGFYILTLTHYMTTGTTSATTFRMRAGVQTSGTISFNGLTGSRFYGGVLASSITITEIAV